MSLPAANPEVVRRNDELMRALDGRMPYMANLGFRLLETGHGHARFLLPCTDASTGDDGGLAGGALLSAVDHAGSLAAWLTMEFGNPAWFGSTVNTKLQIFEPGITRDVIVDARAEGAHGSLIHSRVQVVTAESGVPVATGTTIYRIVRRE